MTIGYTYEQLMIDLEQSSIDPKGTLMVHSSMKSIGTVEGGAETVLDVLIDYMKEGLLLFPTHTWDRDKNLISGIYDPRVEPSCVGLLTNLIMKRPGAYRSLHPSHSVTAIGKGAKAYARKDDQVDTPCPRQGCFASLYEESHGQVLFLGTNFKSNTFIHAVEEWMGIANRIQGNTEAITIRTETLEHVVHHHFHGSTLGSISVNYVKLETPLKAKGIVKQARFGDAECMVAEVKPMADWTESWLKKDTHLFDDLEPIPKTWWT